MYSLESLKAQQWLNTDVRFRPDTELGMLAQRIEERLSLTIPPNISKTELNSYIIDNLDKYFNETLEGQHDLEQLRDFGLKFASTFQGAFEQLSGPVADQIELLSSQIMAAIDSNMKQAIGFYQLEGELKPVQPSFVVLRAPEMASELHTHLKDFMKRHTLTMSSVNLTNFKFLVDPLIESEEVVMSEESLNRVTSELKESIESTCEDAESAKNCVKMLSAALSPSKYREMIRPLLLSGVRSGKLDQTSIFAALAYMKHYPKFKKCMASYDLEVMDDAAEQIQKNLQKMEDLFLLSGCIIELARGKYKDCLVIGPELINGEQFDEFQKKGGMLEDIANHLRLYYNNNEHDIFKSRVSSAAISGGGIKTKQMLISLPSDRQKISELTAEVTTQLLATRQSCTRRAFELIVKQHIAEYRNHPELIPDGFNPPQFMNFATTNLQQALSVLSRNDQANIEDALYSYYLTTFHKNTLVSTIYYGMGAEVIKQLSASENNEDVTSTVHAAVMSDLLAKYVANVFVVRCA